jgi:hypothetical protein
MASKIFILSTTRRRKGRYRLLILDGHGSHLTPQFDQICAENDIIPIYMPAHSSHLLQPLDIGCFGVLKRAYSKVVEAQARLNRVRLDKTDFLEAYRTARTDAFKPETILNSFTGAGIIPFDPQHVISKLDVRLITPPRPISCGSDSSRIFTTRTPQIVKEVRRQASSIRKIAIDDPQSLGDALNQMEKGCQLAIHGFTIARQQITELLVANAKVTRKKRRNKTQIAHDGSLLVQEAISRIGGEREVEEARSDQADRALPALNSTNERHPQRCSICKTPGHKRNRCPERSE